MTTENIKNKVWENEGKTYGFVDKETGYGCFIYRHPRYGHLCGYVDIPATHPLFGIDYRSNIFDMIIGNLEVHGGITFTGRLENPYNINELPYYLDDEHDWLIGFDCNHVNDYTPLSYCKPYDELDVEREYRDAGYVAAECKKLAKQLKKLENVDVRGLCDYCRML